MPSSDNFTPNNVWASNAVTNAQPEELTMPSGQTCAGRKVTVEGMIKTGMLASVDGLTAMVEKYTRKVRGGKGVPDGEVIDESIIRDAEALESLMMMVDQMIPHIVVSPVVHLHFTIQTVGKTKVTKLIPAEDRQAGRIYTDQIELDDKMWLFNWAVGGLAAFSSFRGETRGDVGGVVPRSGPPRKAKRRTGHN